LQGKGFPKEEYYSSQDPHENQKGVSQSMGIREKVLPQQTQGANTHHNRKRRAKAPHVKSREGMVRGEIVTTSKGTEQIT
jgi:hypothetical protein